MDFRESSYGSDDAIVDGQQSKTATHHREQNEEAPWSRFLDRDLAAQHIDPALRSSSTSTHVLPAGAMELLKAWEQEHKEVVDSMRQVGHSPNQVHR